ncbi:MAG: protein kinase [Dehalococcoidales bacterium]|nr:MAG: protein kinase [Dehalococcoidales bacterium]
MDEEENPWLMDDELQTLSIVGKSIADRYGVEKLLGQGGMGSVYLATDELLDRSVAIKLIKPGTVSRQNPGQFYREARSLARMNHPNIVTLYNCGWYEDQAYLVMEYVSGTLLSTILEIREGAYDGKKRLTISEALEIIAKVAAALSYAHGHGVIHCDIKPGNIVVGDEVKLMDFGIARMQQDQSTMPGASVGGTPTYMAPEQALGREVDARSDIYSLGVVLYETLTGQPPFSLSDDISLVSQHIQVTPASPDVRNPGIPKRLSSLILKMLAKNPANRPSDIDEVLTELKTSVRELVDAESTPVPEHVSYTRILRGKAEALKGIPLFASISSDDLAELSEKLQERRYRKGQTIFRKDEVGSALYIIRSGDVRISVPGKEGQSMTLAHLGPGDFFGEMSLLDEKPRSASATAVESTETFILERGDFLEFLRWYPEAAIGIFGVLTQRIRDLNYHLESVIFHNPPARLAGTLLELMRAHGTETPDGWAISVSLSISELAGMAGIAVADVRKLLRSFRKSDILSGKNRRYVIHKPEVLQEVASRR